MKKIIFLALTGFCFGTVYAQNSISITSNPKRVSTIPPKSTTDTLKIAIDKNKPLRIMTPDDAAWVDVEGYDGNELVVEAVTNKFPRIAPTEAAGLTYIPLNNRPAEDNTINYRVRSDNAELADISITTKCKYLHIKVPNHMLFFDIDMRSNRNDSYLSVKNIEGPFQVFGGIKTIHISNVTGPFNISSGEGTVILNHILWNANAVWPDSIQRPGIASQGPYFIRDLGGYIDITISEDLKATLISRGNGRVYSDLNLIQQGKNTVTLNGGGINIFTQTGSQTGSPGTTYLRKQKN